MNQKSQNDHLNLIPSWLEHRPLVEVVNLELPPPSLNDNRGDLDRLAGALEDKGFTPLHVRPGDSGWLARRTRLEGFRVSALVGDAGCHWELIDVLPWERAAPVCGLALDLGTTSLALYLLDLITGSLLVQISVPNPQIAYGEDILTRILYARSPENLQHLQAELIQTLNKTIGDLLSRQDFPSRCIYAMAVAGNTTMSHLFLGLDPSNICKEPYIPAVNRFPFYHGRDLGLEVHPNALIAILPNVGSYFGGDLVAGILAAGFHRSEEVNLLVDIGTNAEVVLGNKDWLVACAGAAGPALEGGVFKRGMIAAPGAIDKVRVDEVSLDSSYRVIGDGPPVGICGSGVVDLVAELFQAGVIGIQGKLNTALRSPRLVWEDEVPAYLLAQGNETEDGRDLLISELDIGIFLKSKAAMYTILMVIVKKVGLSFEDIQRFFIAGTFGSHIDPEMAVRIGMIPDLPLERYEGLGNTAGRGAAMVLLDRNLLKEVEAVRKRITYVELNVNVELMNEFRGALFLPHTDLRLFPSVRIPPEVHP
jgi:uncharacterized 2Fe-2S/4Fe-4S cluster protein (DUF4445 family)